MHFELLWAQAESMAKSYKLLDRKKILQEIQQGVFDLTNAEGHVEYHIAIGNILLGLCSMCSALEENEKIGVNSYAALFQAIERKRAEVLDPKPK